jgi:hypothetical protein
MDRMNGDNMNSVKNEANGHFRNAKKEYEKEGMRLQQTVETRTRKMFCNWCIAPVCQACFESL